MTTTYPPLPNPQYLRLGRSTEQEGFSADQMRAYVDADRAQRAAPAVPEGWKLVPVEPTEAQWGGLARDIMLAFDLGSKSPSALLTTLRDLGNAAPQWLLDEVKNPESMRVLSKGTRAVLIYRAMLAAAPPAAPTCIQEGNDGDERASDMEDAADLIERMSTAPAAQKQCVVAWMKRFLDRESGRWHLDLVEADKFLPEDALALGWTPPQPAREPMSEEELSDAWSGGEGEGDFYIDAQLQRFARAVERHHGIGSKE